MNTTSNTILITGGTSGIGLELAIQLQALGNQVVVTGRDGAKLDRLTKDHPLLHGMQSEVNDPKAIAALYDRVTRDFPTLNILINNAGIMRKVNMQDKNTTLDGISYEIAINLSGPIHMAQQFLPHLKAQPSALIVNVSSGIAFVPFPVSPIYSATKAGLHAFTRSLRMQLRNTNVRVMELIPPLADTPLAGAFEPIDFQGAPKLHVTKIARAFLNGLAKDRPEVLPGLSPVLKFGSRIAPNLMLKSSARSVDAMLAKTNS